MTAKKFQPHPKAPKWVKTQEDEELWRKRIRAARKRTYHQKRDVAKKEQAELERVVSDGFMDITRPRKATKQVKDSINEVFERLGGVDGLETFARRNPKEFYLQIWGKMIPRTKEVDVGENLEELLEQIGNGAVPGMESAAVLIEGEYAVVEEEDEE